MLTDLQRRVRDIVARLPEGGAVALAGGAALIVTGVVQRGTEDLDFFTAHPEPVGPVLEGLETALAAAGCGSPGCKPQRPMRDCWSSPTPTLSGICELGTTTARSI